MSKLQYAALCAVLTVISLGSALAGEAQQAPETKRIGVVFMQQVFQNYQYAKDTEERLKSSFMPESDKLEAEVRRIQEMERALQNNPLKPANTPAWRRSMMEIETAKVEAQGMQEEFARKIREEEAAFWNNMYTAFQRACRILAEYYQYDIIIAAPDPTLSEEVVKALDPMAMQQEILMRRIQYVHDRANLTKSITDLLNHRYQQYLADPQKNTL